MPLSEYFWFGFRMTINPNRVFRKGWEDGICGNPRHQYRLAFIFDHFKKLQDLYDRGYNDGQRERLIRNSSNTTIIKL